MIERSTALERIARSPLEPFSLGDLEAVRILLRGGSVIDWHRLNFVGREQVDRFLRVNEFDPEDERDERRLEHIRGDAVDYLHRNFSFRIPPDIAEGVPAPELFLLATQKGRRQTYACMILKVMHIIHHLQGRELLFKLPISDDQVFHLVEQKVMRVVEEMRGAGVAITEFAWSRKLKDSLITKLLAKKESIAAQVYDKLRFRLVLRERADILPCLRELCHRLIPFNYVVPGESVNGILPLQEILKSPALSRLADELQVDLNLEADPAPMPDNEFSGPGYRIINFVADMPIRLDEFIPRARDPHFEEQGSVVFVLTEFQIVDQAIAQENESGENSHQRYKERQVERVKSRLTSGLKGLRERERRGHGDPIDD